MTPTPNMFPHRYTFLLGLLLFADQLSKWWIVSHWQEFESMPVLPFFNVVLVYNKGAAFSFLADAGGWQHWFFVSLALLVSLILIAMIRKSAHTLERLALTLILSGALGNALDRLRLGKVVDFLDFHAWGYHWPAFNVADSAISVGVVTLILINLKTPAKPH